MNVVRNWTIAVFVRFLYTLQCLHTHPQTQKTHTYPCTRPALRKITRGDNPFPGAASIREITYYLRKIKGWVTAWRGEEGRIDQEQSATHHTTLWEFMRTFSQILAFRKRSILSGIHSPIRHEPILILSWSGHGFSFAYRVVYLSGAAFCLGCAENARFAAG